LRHWRYNKNYCFYWKVQKIEIQFLDLIWRLYDLRHTIMCVDFLYFMFRFCFFFHELIKVTFGYRYFYFFFQDLTFLSVMFMVMMKKVELIRVSCIHFTFHGRRILHKFFISDNNLHLSHCDYKRGGQELKECHMTKNVFLVLFLMLLS
jgi:hypothetical protein